MKEEHKVLLRRLIDERRFPLTEYNTTDEEKLLINDIMADKNAVKKFMRDYARKNKIGKYA